MAAPPDGQLARTINRCIRTGCALKVAVSPNASVVLSASRVPLLEQPLALERAPLTPADPLRRAGDQLLRLEEPRSSRAQNQGQPKADSFLMMTQPNKPATAIFCVSRPLCETRPM